MKRTIAQIDGGHLRALARDAGHDYKPDFIEKVAWSLRATGEDLLRILYYDCAPFVGKVRRPISGTEHEFRKSDGWLRDLAARDLFAVRLGDLKWRGWKLRRHLAAGPAPTDAEYDPDFEQKGVDLRIGLDVATYSMPRLVDRIILVTGDADLVPAMKLARRCSVQVVGIEFPNYRLPPELRAHVDYTRAVPWP